MYLLGTTSLVPAKCVCIRPQSIHRSRTKATRDDNNNIIISVYNNYFLQNENRNMPPELGYRIAVCLLGFAMLAISADANRRFGGVSLALSRPSVPSQNFPSLCLSFRGGDATIADSDDEEEDLDELNGEEADEEAEEESTAKLASSAVKASKKSQAKRATKAKSAVNQKLVHNKITSVQKKQKRRKGIKIPYIIKACFNPFTVLAMTKAYFASLFNLDYGKKVRTCRARVI